MAKSSTISPLIITGMHRSGTSLLTRLLQNFEIDFGLCQDRNNEATFFLRRNEAILKLLGFDWAQIDGFPISFKEFRDGENLIKKLKEDISSISTLSFLGIQKYLNLNSLNNINYSWGWKDPRNTLLLPLWIELFPKSKIINIVRNGVDVANSLLIREQKRKNSIIKRNFSIKALYNQIDVVWVENKYKVTPHVTLNSNLTLQECFDLWASYTFHFEKVLNVNNFTVLSIKYEDLISNPQKTLLDIFRFLEKDFKITILDDVIKSIDQSRGYAFTKNQKLIKFYHLVSNHTVMSRYGYNRIF